MTSSSEPDLFFEIFRAEGCFLERAKYLGDDGGEMWRHTATLMNLWDAARTSHNMAKQRKASRKRKQASRKPSRSSGTKKALVDKNDL